ncbi:ribulokinase, partial [Bacteroidota bacterium]
RSLIVNTSTGEEMATSVFYYPRWKEGKYCDPVKNQFRQHPVDYLDGLEQTIVKSLEKLSDEKIANIIAISVDTTGSTPVAVNSEGVPLSLTPEFAENPNAMFVLWKDHTAVKEAEEINRLSKSWGVDFTKYEGGTYSSEWFWAKVLHVMRKDKDVREAVYSWVEHCDWIPAVLVGDTDPKRLKRSRCAAGHKAMWHENFGGLPSEEFLLKLDPLLKGLKEKLYRDTYTCDVKVGNLSHEWSEKLGLSTDVVIGTGSFDAHLGAVGGQIEPYYLSKVLGTSTCDMIIAPTEVVGDKMINGICGQVDGSILPGMVGLEAGQSAFGDIYAWFSKMLMWPVEEIIAKMDWLEDDTLDRIQKETSENIIAELSEAASKVSLEESTVVAVDWMNGRRTPDANQELKGAIGGLTLGSDAPRIFRALVEATAFGSKMINDRFISEGVRIDGIIALGGVAKKSPFVMQILADVLDMPIKVASSEQTCALGSAMAASVVAGVHKDIPAAQKAMGGGFDSEYHPDSGRAAIYKTIYERYKRFGEYIEGELNT